MEKTEKESLYTLKKYTQGYLKTNKTQNMGVLEKKYRNKSYIETNIFLINSKQLEEERNKAKGIFKK